ncbi:MAG: type II toxin-antitoxin system HicA family toxin [Bacteroides sp.]|nr:type II toxin-antitoxin system HicA family toxin [Prevotella sp.]MCM1407689.1 type II toxin-antitoxin system HicA family toxin [Treponema brennaborense]MCM1469161.1 type II toxin-antitoxin system HicA family toxin [Bacteroides sp.]
MPSKYPILPPNEIIKVLEKIGFRYVSQKGSHLKYSDGSHVVIIPNHSEIARGTLHSILQQAGIGIETFLKMR